VTGIGWIERTTVAVGIVVGLVAGAAVLVLAPVRALAHSQLVSSTPADGSVWSSPPETARLVFSSQVDPALVRVSVAAPDGTAATVRPQVQNRQVIVPVPGSRTAGGYEVRYRVVSVDGHTAAGQVAFRVQQATGAGAPAVLVSSPAAAAAAPASLAQSWPVAVALLVTFAGVGGLALRRSRRTT